MEAFLCLSVFFAFSLRLRSSLLCSGLVRSGLSVRDRQFVSWYIFNERCFSWLMLFAFLGGLCGTGAPSLLFSYLAGL